MGATPAALGWGQRGRLYNSIFETEPPPLPLEQVEGIMYGPFDEWDHVDREEVETKEQTEDPCGTPWRNRIAPRCWQSGRARSSPTLPKISPEVRRLR